MAKVSFTPEAIASFRRLPLAIKEIFDEVLNEFEATERVRLPGSWTVHQLEGARNLWTLKLGQYRGIFRWDGHELRFVRFGRRGSVYQRLPK